MYHLHFYETPLEVACVFLSPFSCFRESKVGRTDALPSSRKPTAFLDEARYRDCRNISSLVAARATRREHTRRISISRARCARKSSTLLNFGITRLPVIIARANRKQWSAMPLKVCPGSSSVSARLPRSHLTTWTVNIARTFHPLESSRYLLSSRARQSATITIRKSRCAIVTVLCVTEISPFGRIVLEFHAECAPLFAPFPPGIVRSRVQRAHTSPTFWKHVPDAQSDATPLSVIIVPCPRLAIKCLSRSRAPSCNNNISCNHDARPL